MGNESKINLDNDTQLMLKVKRSDTEAYEILYKKHFSRVSNFFKKVGNVDGWSEDLAQKVFTCIWEDRESFRAESSFKTFMFGISHILLIIHLRAQRQEHELIKNISVSHIKTCLSEPEAAYHYAELLKNLEINKSKLPKKQRQAIELLLDPDFTPETAAKMANCSNNTYLKRLSDARKRLKKLLKI